MQKKITCKQVEAILPFYLKGRVNPALTEIIEEHLANCKHCKELYLKAFDECSNFAFIEAETQEEADDERFATKEYADFKRKLSAYLDSELEDNENIRIKKMTISNPLARKDLEDMYQFKRLLHSSFARTKENCKHDFSKIILKKLGEQNVSQADFFMHIATILLFLSAVLSIGFLNTH
ncbi:MAG: zf-HC2 domain-containing protein [Fusobacterium sp.]|nr:zf-HC2 domain-containing protein [Fusobacterium sp.]